MKIIYKPRGTGKTTDLVKMSAEKQIPIICMTKATVQHIKDISTKINVNIPEPIDIRGGVPKQLENALVDDAEYILQYLLNVKIECASISSNDII